MLYKLEALNVRIGGVLYKKDCKNPQTFDTSKGAKFESLSKEVDAACQSGFLTKVEADQEQKVEPKKSKK